MSRRLRPNVERTRRKALMLRALAFFSIATFVGGFCGLLFLTPEEAAAEVETFHPYRAKCADGTSEYRFERRGACKFHAWMVYFERNPNYQHGPGKTSR